MTKKEELVWRLGKLPTVEEITTLIANKIITQDEAREILFNKKIEEEREKLAEEKGTLEGMRERNLRGELFRNKIREEKTQMGAEENSFKNEPGSTEKKENGIDNEFTREPIGNGPKMQRGMFPEEGNLSKLLSFGRPGSFTKTKNSGPV